MLIIERIVAKITTIGTVCDQYKRHSGRKRTGRFLENIKIVRNSQLKIQKKKKQCVGFLHKMFFP